MISDFCTPDPKSKGAGSAGKKYLGQYDKQDLKYTSIKTDVQQCHTPKVVTLERTHPYHPMFSDL